MDATDFNEPDPAGTAGRIKSWFAAAHTTYPYLLHCFTSY
jgi:hypothetical protein